MNLLFDERWLGLDALERAQVWATVNSLDHVLKVKADYVDASLDAIRKLKPGTSITSETLRDLVGDPPTEVPNCIAGILKTAASAKHNLIVITSEEVTAKRTKIHAKKLSIWRRI